MAHNSLTAKFIKWLITRKCELTSPVPFRVLYNEYPEEKPAFDQKFPNYARQMFYTKKIRRDYTIPQIVYAMFILSVPVSKELEAVIKEVGELQLNDQGRRITHFSNGNCFWEGEHRRWTGRKQQVQVVEEEMPLVEEDDEAQKTQEALEEKFWRKHHIDVAEMSERNKIQDQTNGQHSVERMDEYAYEHLQHVPNNGERIEYHVHNQNTLMEIKVKEEVSVASLRNAPGPSQQSSSPSTTPALAQNTAPAITGAHFFKALKKVAYTCDQDDVLEAIQKTEKKVENRNLSIPIVDIIVPFTCILNDIKNLSGKNEHPSGPKITAELYLSSLNSAVLTLGSMEPLIKMIEKITESVRSKKMNISAQKIRADFGTLLDVVGSSV